MRHSECARDRIVLGEEARWPARWDDAIEKTRRSCGGGMERHRGIQSVLGIESCSGGEARWPARWDDAIEKTRRPRGGGMERHRGI